MESQVKNYFNRIDKGIVILDEEGKVIFKNTYYLDNFNIDILNLDQTSVFSSALLSTDQKDRLFREGKLTFEIMNSPKSGEYSKIFPERRMIDNKFLRVTIIAHKNDKKSSFTLLFDDISSNINGSLDSSERNELWRRIAILGNQAYFKFNVNRSEWYFSDNICSFLSVDNDDIETILKILSKTDRSMLSAQWVLSLSDPGVGNIFEYTFKLDMNGTTNYFSVRWSMDRTSISNPVIYGLLMNITVLSRTEAALTESLTQMALLTGVEDVVLWSYDIEEDQFKVYREMSSDYLADLLSLPTDKSKLKFIFSHIDKVDTITILREYKELLNGELSSTNVKFTIKNQNHNYIFVSTSFVVQRSSVANQPAALMGITKVHPITSKYEEQQQKLRRKSMEEFKKTILIAEDVDNNYDLLNVILRKEYKLVRAVNGIEAVKLFSNVKPDLILMDIKMPEMGGLEATKLIRMESKTVPIIAVTAFAFGSDREVALEAGCDDFLSKPIDIPVLKSIIKKYLAKAE